MREKRSNSWMRRVAWAGVPALVTVAFVFSYGQALSQEMADVTFTRDVAPILQQNCQICHREGAIGPMSLITYEQAKMYAPLIKLKVTTQQMPPYQYDTDVGIQGLKNDMRLSPEEIETLAQWVDQGAAEGDPADMPSARRTCGGSPSFPSGTLHLGISGPLRSSLPWRAAGLCTTPTPP